jgi:hypothetical protein
VQVGDQQRIAYNFWAPHSQRRIRVVEQAVRGDACPVNVGLAARLCQETAVRAATLQERCETIDEASVDWPCVFQV